MPAANQPAVVTANVRDPDGLQNLTLYYRLDPATTYTAVPMKDDGTGGDAIAGRRRFQRDDSGTGGESNRRVLHFGHR